MKKRVKLLTTIASLCLAVALMAFGVYAATIGDLKVSGSVSFSSVEIDGEWTKVTVTLTNAKFSTGGTTKEFTPTATEGVYSDIEIGEIVADKANQEVTILITAYFKNSSDTDAQLTGQALTESKTEEGLYTLTAQAADTTADAGANTQDKTVAVTYKFTALDAAQTVDPVDFDANFKAGIKPAQGN